MVSKRRTPLLKLKVDGPGIRSGAISVPDLVRICQHAQTAVNRQAEALSGERTLRRGPVTAAVKQECTLELVGISKGSVELRFDLAKPQVPLPEMKDFGTDVVVTVASVIDGLGADSKQRFDPGVLDSLKNLGDVFEGGSISTIEWVVPRRPGKKRLSAVYTKAVRERVLERVSRPEHETRTLEGILEMADFKQSDEKCRIHPPLGHPVVCTFDEGKENDIYALLRKPVRVTGKATLDPYTKRLDSIHIKSIDPVDPLILGAAAFLAPHSLEELAELQGVKPLQDTSILAGGLPDDENLDELLDDIYNHRETV